MTAPIPPEHGSDARTANWVQCKPCGHRWIGFYLPLPIADAAKVMKRMMCPLCAADSAKIIVFDGSVKP